MAATGARPPFAIAAQNVTACCSAIATSKNLSGYFDANSVSPVPSGIAAVTARGLGAKLGSSVKPIFSLFENVEEVQNEVLKAAEKLSQARIRETMESGQYPPYKASGIAYICFAREEKELFKLLYMRDRSRETFDEGDSIKPLIEEIQKQTGLSEEDAYRFHLEMWVYVHGIATMIATSYLEWDLDTVSEVLTDAYVGLKYRFSQKNCK